MKRPVALAALVLALTACGGEEQDAPPVERLARAPLELVVEAEGQLKSVKATPLLVPGQNWA